MTEREIEAAQEKLNNQLDTILQQSSVSDSGIVSPLAAEVRGHQQFRDAGGEEVEPPEGVSVESIMLTKVPVRETVEQDAIAALSEALHGPNLNELETTEENLQDNSENEPVEDNSNDINVK